MGSEMATSQDFVNWICSHELNPRFLMYVLLSEHSTFGSFASGTTHQTIYFPEVKAFHICMPCRHQQDQVVNVLSAYDELIENNARRIEILEEMAQAIYREWFVEFRYPGHEDVPLVDSELGPIPEGWVVRNLGQVAKNFDRLRRPLSSLERATMQGPFPYYGAAKVFDYVNDFLFDGTYLLVAEDGSVIDAGGFPVLQYVSGRFWANNHTHVLQGSEVSTEYLYLLLSSTNVSGLVTGAAQPKINQGNLNRITVLVPTTPLLDAMKAVVAPIFDLMGNLGLSNESLRKTRDLLLPRLISGEIDVSGLDIELADSPV